MKLLILIAAIALTALGADNSGLLVTFGFSDALRDKKSFFTMPRTLQEVTTLRDWYRLPRPEGRLPSLVMYCQITRTACPLYHPTSGDIAGLQMAIPVNDYENTAFAPETRWVKWNAPAVGRAEAKEFWTATQYYMAEEDLKSGDWKADTKQTLPSKGVWVNDLDNNPVLLPLKEVDITPTLYKKQNCFQNMGTHYFYNMTETMPCDKLMPWFGLYKEGQLIGTGFQTYGVIKNKDDHKQWSESPPAGKFGLSFLIPKAPECVYDGSTTYGLISMHAFYINNPWEIKCESKDSISPPNFIGQMTIDAIFAAAAAAERLEAGWTG